MAMFDPTKMTNAQKRLLNGLREAGNHGGIFDRWVRVVANGEILTPSGSSAALTAFRYGLVKMDGERIRITDLGRAALERVDPE